MSDLLLNQYGAATVGDFGSMFCKRQIGRGIGREVYVLETDPTKIVKIEIGSQSFQNVIEWETWDKLEDTPHAKWLAPCRHISPCGIVLIMDRTQPLRPGEEPDRMPAWLNDHKRSNYGRLGKRVVCHDYGTNLLLNHGAFNSRMRKVEWVAP